MIISAQYYDFSSGFIMVLQLIYAINLNNRSYTMQDSIKHWPRVTDFDKVIIYAYVRERDGNSYIVRNHN